MNVKINGEIRICEDGITLGAVIRSLGIEDKVMAAALNMEIVKQEKWDEALLHDGDTIELLDFVGGG